MQFKNTAAAALPGYAVLDRVLNGQFEIKQEEGDAAASAMAIPREPADLSCDGVSNPADPDASYKAQTAPHCGLGYMAQIVETYAEDDGPAYETAEGHLI